MNDFSNFEELSQEECVKIEGGVAPIIIFLGKAALSGIGFGIGYFGLKKVFD